MAMRFRRVVVVGTGSVACACIEAMLALTLDVAAVEAEYQPFSAVRGLCNRHRVEYVFVGNRREATEYFLRIVEPTLIVSAHNRYLFPLELVTRAPLTIVNFHNSLLPKHAGRNAPTWAIYEMDEIAGVTWHMVSPEVDKGDVVAQRATPITAGDTGLSLTRRCADLGIKLFQEIVPSLLSDDFVGRRQAEDLEGRLHLSTEVPNDGWLDPVWGCGRMSAFLRSLDFGALRVFPRPRIRINDRERTVLSYLITVPGVDKVGRGALEGRADVVFEDRTARVELSIE